MKKQIAVSLDENIMQMLREDSSKFGLSMSGYVSQLIAQKNLELNTAKLINVMKPEELRKALDEQSKGAK